MDQFKAFLGVLRRQHFWFIAPILLVVGLVGWMMAKKQLTQQYETSKSKVQGYISQMQAVSSQRPHPNDDYQDGMNQLITQRRDNVRSAWERKWERQKQELKWPEELGAKFINRVEQMRPIEKVDVDRRSIPSSERYMYQGFIKKMLPRLAAHIGAKWQPATAGRSPRGFGRERGGRDGGGPGTREEQPSLVDWDPNNQALIEARFDWGAQAPSTLEVLYAQEDLWVLTTLIEIIKRTNGDAMIHSQAAIKAIDFIQIGKDVKPPSQQGFHVIKPAPLDVEDGLGADEDELAESEESIEFGPDSVEATDELDDGTAVAKSQAIKMELVKNRYYDKDYEPIGHLAKLMSSVTVAKRIPVRLRVRMNQRQVSRLLVECGNAPLTFEVRQLRFSPKDNSLRVAATSEGGLFAKRAVKTLDDYESLDRTVELFGIIYIFNPIDEAVLNGEVADEAVSDDDTAAIGPKNRTLDWQLVSLN